MQTYGGIPETFGPRNFESVALLRKFGSVKQIREAEVEAVLRVEVVAGLGDGERDDSRCGGGPVRGSCAKSVCTLGPASDVEVWVTAARVLPGQEAPPFAAAPEPPETATGRPGPIPSDSRAPHSTRERRSRPKLSVPNQCAFEGASSRCMRSWAAGSWGASRGRNVQSTHTARNARVPDQPTSSVVWIDTCGDPTRSRGAGQPRPRCGARARGSESETVVPRPCALSISTRPPWERATRATIARPRPVP